MLKLNTNQPSMKFFKALQNPVDSFIRLAQACQYRAFCYLNSSTLLQEVLI